MVRCVELYCTVPMQGNVLDCVGNVLESVGMCWIVLECVVSCHQFAVLFESSISARSCAVRVCVVCSWMEEREKEYAFTVYFK